MLHPSDAREPFGIQLEPPNAAWLSRGELRPRGPDGSLEPTARKGERRVVSEPVAEALFELEGEGELSEPFAVDGGWAVVSLVKTVPGREPQFERVNAMIKSEIRRKRVERFVEALRHE